MNQRKKVRLPWVKYVALGCVVFFSAFLGFLFALGTHLALFEIFVTFLPSESFLASSNILILGQDEEGFAKRADTIILTRIEPATKSVQLISIPRDTRVPIPGYGLDKINHAHAFGGAQLTQKALQEWLSVPIPYYVSVHLDGLVHFIDQLGGLELDVEENMRYADYAGGLFIHIDRGRQKLDGKKAVGYLRYRGSTGGDLGRIKRQQRFLRALLGQIAETNPLQIPMSLVRLASFFDTNLSSKEILGLAMVLRQSYDLGQIESSTLEGFPKMINGVFYLEAEPNAREWLKEKMGAKEKL